MKKKTLSKLKINKETVKSVLDAKEMNEVKGGYVFSLIGGCSHSLCFSQRCTIGVTFNSYQCCH